MIEHSIVNGKSAMVAYLKNGFEPATKDDATLVKVMWDDGDMAFLIPSVSNESVAKADWDEAKHPRAEDGRFGEVGYGESTGQMADLSSRDAELKQQIDEAFGRSVNVGFNDAKGLEAWRRTFGSVGPAEVRSSMLGPLSPNLEGVSLSSGPYGDGIDFRFAGYDDEGAPWEMSRVVISAYDGDSSTAIHLLFRLPKSMQGKGIAKAVLASQIALYERIGVSEVHLNANIDIGGYAWAKYGFVPTDDSFDSLKDDLGSGYRTHGQWTSQDGSVNEPLSAIQMEVPRDIWKVADSPQGKTLLINSDWRGVLDLNDKEAMARFNSYIRKSK